MIIEELIDHLAKSRELAGWEYVHGTWTVDADHALGNATEIAKFRVRVTSDSRCLLDIQASLNDSVASMAEVQRCLHRAWNYLSYKKFQASSCIWYRESMILRFVSALSDDASLVTGRIIVSGARYKVLAREHEESWQRRLPSRRG